MLESLMGGDWKWLWLRVFISPKLLTLESDKCEGSVKMEEQWHHAAAAVLSWMGWGDLQLGDWYQRNKSYCVSSVFGDNQLIRSGIRGGFRRGECTVYTTGHWQCRAVYRNVQDSVQEYTGMYRNVQECTELYITAQVCTGLYRTIYHCTIVQDSTTNIHNCSVAKIPA